MSLKLYWATLVVKNTLYNFLQHKFRPEDCPVQGSKHVVCVTKTSPHYSCVLTLPIFCFVCLFVCLLHLSCLTTCWLHNRERKDGCEWQAGVQSAALSGEQEFRNDHLLNSVTKWNDWTTTGDRSKRFNLATLPVMVGWLMDWKAVRKKSLLTDWGAFVTFAWRAWVKTRRNSGERMTGPRLEPRTSLNAPKEIRYTNRLSTGQCVICDLVDSNHVHADELRITRPCQHISAVMWEFCCWTVHFLQSLIHRSMQGKCTGSQEIWAERVS